METDFAPSRQPPVHKLYFVRLRGTDLAPHDRRSLFSVRDGISAVISPLAMMHDHALHELYIRLGLGGMWLSSTVAASCSVYPGAPGCTTIGAAG